MPRLQLDHIVLAVPSLNEAVIFFQENLGVTPIMGGKHIGLGTHNALLSLGDPNQNAYLELLAIDPEDETYYDHYPMGLTKDIQESYVASWCIRCTTEGDINEINEAMKKMGSEYQHGDIRKMQRVMKSGEVLSWKIANTREQVLASNGQVPFLIKWDNFSLHPTTKLSRENFCQYILEFAGPNADIHKENLQKFGLEIPNSISFTDAPYSSSTIFKLYNQNHMLTFGKPKVTNSPVVRLG